MPPVPPLNFVVPMLSDASPPPLPVTLPGVVVDFPPLAATGDDAKVDAPNQVSPPATPGADPPAPIAYGMLPVPFQLVIAA